MSFRIDDGKGQNGYASVSNNQRLNVSARSAGREYYESRDNGQVYTALIVDAGAVAGEETAYLKNTSTTKDLIIESIHIGSAAATTWRIKFVTGTATGTDVVPINLNKVSSNAADAECKGGAGGVTGLTDDGFVSILRVGAGETGEWDSHEALRLGQNDSIAIENTTSGNGEISIDFHFDSQ